MESSLTRRPEPRQCRRSGGDTQQGGGHRDQRLDLSPGAGVVPGARVDVYGTADLVFHRSVVRVTTVTRLEIGYSARTGTDLRAGLRQPPVSAMPAEYLTPAVEDRAVEVLTLLAD